MAKSTIAEFQPERLTQARKLRGMSMPQLAKALNLTRQAISLYEKKEGGNSPSASTLISLAKELDVNISFFTLPLRESEIPDNITYNFRALKTSLVSNKDKVKVCVSLIGGTIEFLKGYINLKSSIPEFEVSHFNELSEDEISDLAMKTRRAWGLGDGVIPDLTQLMENKGVLVSYLDFANGIDGVSAWVKGVPIVILSKNKSAVRSRASLAHELGHLILHKSVTEDLLKDKKNLDLIERQAWYFASCFLMPETTISNEIYSLNIDNLKLVKSKWKVSIAMLLRRLKDLGLITVHQYKRAIINLYAKHGRVKEPLDDEIIHEQSTLPKKIISLLQKENILTSSDIYHSLGYPDDVLFQVAQLSKPALESYSANNVFELKKYSS